MMRFLFPPCIALALILIGPWWGALAFILLCMWLFPHWYSGIALAFFSDAVYATGGRFGGFGFVMTTVACLAFVCIELLRARIVLPVARP